MPGAKPTQATIGNAIKAIISSGMTPGAVYVDSNGGFRVEISLMPANAGVPAHAAHANGPDALTWENDACE